MQGVRIRSLLWAGIADCSTAVRRCVGFLLWCTCKVFELQAAPAPLSNSCLLSSSSQGLLSI